MYERTVIFFITDISYFMGFLDKLSSKFAPISDEKAIEIIRSNLGLIESLTNKFIKNNGATEDVTKNQFGRQENNSNNKKEKNTFEKTLDRVSIAFPEFYFKDPYKFVCCYMFHMYVNPNLDKDSKKELSNYLSNGVFSVFVDKACSYLWNDIGKFLFIPRTEQQVLDQGRIVNNFYDIMFEYPYIFEGRSVSYRNNDIRESEIQRKR